jgi:hypothetical protein
MIAAFQGEFMSRIIRVALLLCVIALAAGSACSRGSDPDEDEPFIDTPRRFAWNTFLGGDAEDDDTWSPIYENARGILAAGDGGAFVLMESPESWGSPRRPFAGGTGISVAKLDAEGNLLWNTFLGCDRGNRINDSVIDPEGNLYILGTSQASWGDPLRPFADIQEDAFILLLDPNGEIKWLRFLANDNIHGTRIALDASRNIYLSATLRGALPGHGQISFNGVLTKLDPACNRLWSVVFGGNDNDYPMDLCVDAAGNTYVVGNSESSWGAPVQPFKSSHLLEETFAAKFAPDGTMLWNTFLGNCNYDSEPRCSADKKGNLYVSADEGTSLASPPQYSHRWGFVAKLNDIGELSWRTFLAGESGTPLVKVKDLILFQDSVAYIVGMSSNAWGNPVDPYSGSNDAFVASVDAAGKVVWNTFLGGRYIDEGTHIAINAGGDIYVSGISHQAWGEPRDPFSGINDVFAAKLKK